MQPSCGLIHELFASFKYISLSIYRKWIMTRGTSQKIEGGYDLLSTDCAFAQQMTYSDKKRYEQVCDLCRWGC